MSLLGNGVFADIAKVRIEMRAYWIMEGPKSNECPLKRQKTITGTLREEGHVKTEAEMLPPAGECQEPPRAGGDKKNSSLDSPEGMWPYRHLGFRFLVSITKRINFC